MARRRITRNDGATVVGPQQNADNIVALSTGIELKVRRVNPVMISDILTQFQRPNPPRVYIQSIGREEENPSDPEYIQRLEAYQTESTMAIIDAMIVSGTEVNFVPDDIQRVEDFDWRETLEASGILISANPKKLYLTWVKHVACAGEDDINSIVEAVGRRTGVSERDVQAQIALFRRKS